MTNTATPTKLILKIFLFIIALFISVFLIALFPTIAHAEPIDVCTQFGGCATNLDQYKNEEGIGGIIKIVQDATLVFVFVSTPVAVVIAVFGGYKMLVSAGNEKLYKSGLETLTYAGIGLVVIILSSTIVALIAGLLSQNVASTPSDKEEKTSLESKTETDNKTEEKK
jgi:Type IV secretion system pilin